MKQLVFATSNANKVKEIQHIMGAAYNFLSLDDIECTEDIPETQATIKGNALQKARYVYQKYGKNFGLIFQATDDLLDYEGKKNITGKHTQKDLKKNKGSILKYKDSKEIRLYCKKLAKSATITSTAFSKSENIFNLLIHNIIGRVC